MNAPADRRKVATNIAETLDKAAAVLQQLEDSLTRSGFATGADAYVAMCQILVGQRLWSLANQLDELEPRFLAVAERARAVHALLAPYADIMARLGSMTEALNAAWASNGDEQKEATASPSPPAVEKETNTKADAVLQALLMEGGGPVSFTALKARLGIATEELRRILDELASGGAVTHRKTSGRHVYALVQSRHQG